MEEIMQNTQTGAAEPQTVSSAIPLANSQQETVSAEDTSNTTSNKAIDNRAEVTTPCTVKTASKSSGSDTVMTIPVKFNKQRRDLSVEEATVFAQKGLKWDSFTPTHEKLKFLANATNQSVEQLVDALVDCNEKDLYSKILEECGGKEELANRLYEADKKKWQYTVDQLQNEEAKAAKTEQEQLTDRLANEFLELSQEVPEMKDISAVPDKVLEMAVEKGIPLLDAFLRYERSEARKAQELRSKAEASARNSTGSMKGATNAPSPEIDAMMRGLWG